MITRHGFMALLLFFALGAVEAKVEAKAEVGVETTMEAGAVYLPLPPKEISALQELYNATDGANWRNNTNWSKNAPCTWYGVLCSHKRYKRQVQVK